MCIFSQQVQHVAETNIFARVIGERQILVYEMRLASDNDVAMILPIPTRHTHDDPVSFINLSRYKEFFEDMDRCFPSPESLDFLGAVAAAAGETLAVHRVGAFDASFVPSIPDFARLDERFRLGDDVWSSLPVYHDYGFALFQLRAGEAQIHPMAFSFATRTKGQIYFPTTHVHDRDVHAIAHFDHLLYAQHGANLHEWSKSSLLPREVMDLGNQVIADRSRGTVDPDRPISRRILLGDLPNGDTWLPIEAS